MSSRQKKTQRPVPRTILRLLDLEQSKNAVLNSLAAASFQESYRHAMEEFITWYSSESRLSFSRAEVLRYRFFLGNGAIHGETRKRGETGPSTGMHGVVHFPRVDRSGVCGLSTVPLSTPVRIDSITLTRLIGPISVKTKNKLERNRQSNRLSFDNL